MNILNRLAIYSLIVLSAVASHAQNACTLDYHPDRIRIFLAGCPAGASVSVRRNDNTKIALTLENGILVADGDEISGKMGDVKLCSEICGYASECNLPVAKWDKDTHKCNADYKFTCGPTSWKLLINSKPAGAQVTFERVGGAIRQRGVVTATPKTLVCDLAYTEQLRVTEVDAVAKDYPVSYDALDGQRPKPMELEVGGKRPKRVGAVTHENEIFLSTPKKVIFALEEK